MTRTAVTIPTPERYDQAGETLFRAIDEVERIAIALRRVVNENGDLSDGAPPPTLADLGGLYAFADDISDQVGHLARLSERLNELLGNLNVARLGCTRTEAAS